MLHQRPWCVCVAAVLGAVMASGLAPVPKPKPTKPDQVMDELKRLQGRWEYVSFNRNGERLALTPGGAEVIRGDELAVVSSDSVLSRWKLAVDPSKRPGTMDLDEGEGRRRLACVYKLEGDTLTVAYSDQVRTKERPADFTPRKGLIVQVLKRKRP
jgi:uncharacterized protein (TIGR03067 family)